MYRTLIFALFAASASAFSTSPAFARPSTSLFMSGGGEGTHGLGGVKTEKDMSFTSSTDSQDQDKEVASLENAVEKAEAAAKDIADKITGDK